MGAGTLLRLGTPASMSKPFQHAFELPDACRQCSPAADHKQKSDLIFRQVPSVNWTWSNFEGEGSYANQSTLSLAEGMIRSAPDAQLLHILAGCLTSLHRHRLLARESRDTSLPARRNSSEPIPRTFCSAAAVPASQLANLGRVCIFGFAFLQAPAVKVVL